MVDRRHVLQMGAMVTLAATSLAGCNTAEEAPTPPPEPETTPNPQQSDELALIAAYDVALASAGPVASVVYGRLREEHVAHLAALGWEQPPPAPAVGSSIRRRELIRAERLAARTRSNAAATTPDVEQAQILALIAASEAQHVVALEDL